jgi:long-chain acyl-CoA synthetase
MVMIKKYDLYDVPKITSVQEMILLSAKKYGPKIALEDLNETPIRKLTFRELLEHILLFGSALQELGLKERTHIALIGENRVQ